MNSLDWIYHQSNDQYLMISTMVILLRLSTIDTRWTQRVVSLLLQQPSPTTQPQQPQSQQQQQHLSVAQRLQIFIPPIFYSAEAAGFESPPNPTHIGSIREGKELSEEHYLTTWKELLSYPEYSFYGFGILRIANIVKVETIRELIVHLQPTSYYPKSPLTLEHLRYLLHINSIFWKQQQPEYKVLQQRLIVALNHLLQIYPTVPRKNEDEETAMEKECDMIQQAIVKLESAGGGVDQILQPSFGYSQ